MLFNSREFIFGFLPIALLLFHVLRVRLGGRTAMGALFLASLFFYGWWNPPYLALLAGSIAVNYGFARLLWAKPGGSLLALAVGANLAVLGYFKYRNFFLENVGLVAGETWNLEPVFIPLAISFFTFQQIAFLIDVRDGQVPVRKAADYALFVAFFPQLIAGPIVLYREIHQQFHDLKAGQGAGLSMLGAGVVVFALGLFKKVALADSIAPYSDLAFSMVDRLTMLEAWAAAAAFSLQLYFDFSGYSDMAVGLGLMFGIRLPLNFDTPFRATSMIEFWQRWHITMTRFFMMYLYSPIALAFSRAALARGWAPPPAFVAAAAAPIAITFLLSGLWHGAAWTFVAFGAVNAAGLIANHVWKEAKLPRPPAVVGWGLTMLTVVVSFVYFRAETMADAHRMLALMVSPADLVLPNWLAAAAEALALPWRTLAFFATGSYTVRLTAWIVIAFGCALLLANPAKRPDDVAPGWTTAAATAAMLWFAVGLLDRPQSFIYFQF